MFVSSTVNLLPPPKPQFKAVILAGYGTNLYPLVDTEEDEHQSTSQIKATLPVARRAMIDWVIEAVEAAGLYDCLVLSPASLAGPLASHLRAAKAGTDVKLELETVPETVARTGAAASLAYAASHGFIRSDFVVLPCDLLTLPSPEGAALSLASLVDQHRIRDNLLTALFYERAAGAVPEPAREGPARVLTVYDDATQRLLDVRDLDDLDGDITLRRALLRLCPAPTLTTALLPTQVVICSAAVLDLLCAPENQRRVSRLETLTEVVAWVARGQWRAAADGDAAAHSRPHPNSDYAASYAAGGGARGAALARSTTHCDVVGPSTPGSPRAPDTALASVAASGAASPTAVRAGADGLPGPTTCQLITWHPQHGFCGRANLVSSYIEQNKRARTLFPAAASTAALQPGTIVSPDSLIHPTLYSNLGAKAILKRVIIGKNVAVGKDTRLNNVIIMDDVKIGDGVIIENCVLSAGVQIRGGAVLKNCDVGRNYIVDGGESFLGGEWQHKARRCETSSANVRGLVRGLSDEEGR